MLPQLVGCTSLKEMINKSVLLEDAYRKEDQAKEHKRKALSQINRSAGPQRLQFGSPFQQQQSGRPPQGQSSSYAPPILTPMVLSRVSSNSNSWDGDPSQVVVSTSPVANRVARRATSRTTAHRTPRMQATSATTTTSTT